MISVILPTFNEAGNISEVVAQLSEALTGKDYEIIIIDDNSTDGTQKVLKNLKGKRVRVYVRESKQGIGTAYKYGFKLAKGDVIVVMDSDLSHSPKDLPRMISMHGSRKNTVVFSTRYSHGGKIIGWGWFRHLVSSTANGLTRALLKIPVSDVTSSYRVYSRDVFDRVLSKAVSNGFAFQMEAAYYISRDGVEYFESPITFVDRRKGKSKFNVWEILSFMCIVLQLLVAGWS